MTVVVPAMAPAVNTADTNGLLPARRTASAIAAFGSMCCHGTTPTVTHAIAT